MSFLFFIQNAFAADEDLANKLMQIEVSKEYFSHILNSQTLIFSLIVAGIIALFYLLNYRISEDKIKKEVDRKLKEEMEKLKKENSKQEMSLIDLIFDLQSKVNSVRGEVYRGHGNLFQSQKNFSVAFIWWMRAASEYNKASVENLVRLCLDSAKRSLENIENAYEITADNIGEAQSILEKIDDKKFKLEKEALFETLKNKMGS